MKYSRCSTIYKTGASKKKKIYFYCSKTYKLKVMTNSKQVLINNVKLKKDDDTCIRILHAYQ